MAKRRHDLDILRQIQNDLKTTVDRRELGREMLDQIGGPAGLAEQIMAAYNREGGATAKTNLLKMIVDIVLGGSEEVQSADFVADIPESDLKGYVEQILRSRLRDEEFEATFDEEEELEDDAAYS